MTIDTAGIVERAEQYADGLLLYPRYQHEKYSAALRHFEAGYRAALLSLQSELEARSKSHAESRQQWQIQLVAEQQRVKELERDARRYRWLRDSDSNWSVINAEKPHFCDGCKGAAPGMVMRLGSRYIDKHMDARIDAALSSTGE